MTTKVNSTDDVMGFEAQVLVPVVQNSNLAGERNCCGNQGVKDNPLTKRLVRDQLVHVPPKLIICPYSLLDIKDGDPISSTNLIGSQGQKPIDIENLRAFNAKQLSRSQHN